MENNKEIWKTIYGILNPSTTTIKGNVNKRNKYFNDTAKRVIEKSPTKFSDKSLPANLHTETFMLEQINSEEVLEIIIKNT